MMQWGQKEVVSFLGPPGSGKGTIAQMWEDERDVLVLSTGALFRKHVREQTSFGKKFSKLLAQGGLIPDDLVAQMVKDWLHHVSGKGDHILLDGYPRTTEQVYHWHAMIQEVLPDYRPRVVLFEISDQALVQRLSRRLVCKNTECQEIYTASDNLSMCAACSAPLERRKDDTIEVVEKRLQIYADHKDAMLKAYRELGITVDVFDVEHVQLGDMYTQFSKVLYHQNSQGSASV